MPTYRLDLEYDGADFHGWQVQPGLRTVQGEVRDALERVGGEPIRLVGAGRTDAGVHARMQVASFESAIEWEPARLLRAVNSHLRPDVRVWRAGCVTPGFSARAAARSRRYVYRMLRQPSVFERRTHLELRWPVDEVAMAEAANHFLGAHEFAAFAASPADDGTYACTVVTSRITSEGRAVDFEIAANRFLHNMVRRLTGTLVEVGRGRLDGREVTAILAAGDPRRSGPCLPASGLCLVEVEYPADPEFERTAVVDAPPATL